MKTRKMIFGFTAALFVFAVTFIACKKNSDDPVPGKQNAVEDVNSMSGARTSGSQTYYSKSEDETTFYRMDLTWGEDGTVTVDRHEVTEYPTGVETGWQFGDDTPYTVFDSDTTTSDVDSLYVTFIEDKKYYVIPFTPGDPVICNNTNPGPGGYAVSCQCMLGNSCKLVTNSGGYFTCNRQSCSRCLLTVVNRFNDQTVISETSLVVGGAGCVFIEAEDINITN